MFKRHAHTIIKYTCGRWFFSFVHHSTSFASTRQTYALAIRPRTCADMPLCSMVTLSLHSSQRKKCCIEMPHESKPHASLVGVCAVGDLVV